MEINARLFLDGPCHFCEFPQSEEKVASNILTIRLCMPEAEGIVTRHDDNSHKQNVVYSFTQKRIDLFRAIMSIAEWSLKYKPVESEKARRARQMKDGGVKVRNEVMYNLSIEHLGQYQNLK